MKEELQNLDISINLSISTLVVTESPSTWNLK